MRPFSQFPAPGVMRWKRKNAPKSGKFALLASCYQPSTNNYQLPKQVPKFNKKFWNFEIFAPSLKNHFQSSIDPAIQSSAA